MESILLMDNYKKTDIVSIILRNTKDMDILYSNYEAIKKQVDGV